MEIDGVGMAKISTSSSELVGVLGRYFKGELVEWRAAAERRLGVCLCFFEMLLANGTKLWAAIIDEVQHSGHGVWRHLQRVIVNAALLGEAVPFVQERDSPGHCTLACENCCILHSLSTLETLSLPHQAHHKS